jgi:hypothetical protein
MVHKKANWVLKLAGLDAKLADAIIDGLRKLTARCRPIPPSGPDQGRGSAGPTRQRSSDRPETRERVEAIKEQLLDNQSVSLWLDALWQKAAKP